MPRRPSSGNPASKAAQKLLGQLTLSENMIFTESDILMSRRRQQPISYRRTFHGSPTVCQTVGTHNGDRLCKKMETAINSQPERRRTTWSRRRRAKGEGAGCTAHRYQRNELPALHAARPLLEVLLSTAFSPQESRTVALFVCCGLGRRATQSPGRALEPSCFVFFCFWLEHVGRLPPDVSASPGPPPPPGAFRAQD